MALPAWLAVIEQVPAVRRVMCRPLTVQTGRVVEVRVTGRVELALAEAVTGDWRRVLLGMLAKVIDWLTWLTANDRVTGLAGA